MERGLPASQVADLLNCNRRWVYLVAKELNLPTNPPIKPGSPRESAVLVALVKAGYESSPTTALTAVALAFNQAPCNIRSILTRVRNDPS